MAMVIYNSIFFCFAYNVFIWEESVLKMFVFKLSSKFSIYTFLIPPLDVLEV